MANSAQYQALVNKRTSGAHAPILPSEESGTVRLQYAKLTLAGTANGTANNMFIIPKNARILGGKMVYTAMGANTELAVGTAGYNDKSGTAQPAVANAFKASAASTSAGLVDIAATAAKKLFEVIETDDQGVVLTVTNGGSGAATGEVEVYLNYVVN